MRLLVFLFLCLDFLFLSGQTAVPDITRESRLKWFREAKLGIFIHWGIYSVDGIDESWSFFNEYITWDDYMKQLDGFTADKYDPVEWAKLIRESGARYAVLTARHHDGVALWNSGAGGIDVVKRTPAARDLVNPFTKALREQDLRVGIYYSLPDWSHPDYPNFTRTKKRYENDSLRWSRYQKYNLGQIQEITTLFSPDLFWFDGDWEHTAPVWESARIREMILSELPHAVINSRLAGYGDYATPEQGVPVLPPVADCWELCMTINDSWGYQGNDRNFKTPYQVIHILADCISMGGNLLLDIGPREDGTIPDEEVAVLKELGRWTAKHRDAVYTSIRGIPSGHFYGPTALSPDSTILYLFLDKKPAGGQVFIKGLRNKMNRIWVVGSGVKLNHEVLMKQYWSDIPGILSIDVPGEVLDEHCTVIAVLLDGPVRLFREY